MHPRVIRLFESSIPSGNAWKVSLALAQLGHADGVEVVQLDIMAKPSETRRPEFLAKNPNGRIPLVELDDGSFLPESNAILVYLLGGTRWWPSDPLAQARALSWMFFEQYSHEPYVAVLKFWTYWVGPASRRTEDVALWRPAGQAASDVMEGFLGSSPWFTGAAYGAADIALFAYTHSAAAIGFSVGPEVSAWLDRVRAEPGWVPIKA